ncbi:MAG: LytTR family DNA-binding domain-containing protein [Blautia sp.]|nr:LytTR family DNA-binding domain-containing protein [Blautia sp.]
MYIAICDNDMNEQKQTASALMAYCDCRDIDITYRLFSSGSSLLECPDLPMFDIIFLDIYMPGDLSGIETANALKLRHIHNIVFLTVSPEYALEAFQLNALHYIMKPASPDDIAEVITRFSERQLPSRATVTVKMKKQTLLIPQNKIVFIEIMNRICTIHTLDGQYSFYATLRDISEQLDETQFIQVNRSYIINAEYILSYTTSFVTIHGNKEIPVSRMNRDKIISSLENYLFTSVRRQS